MRYHSPGCGTQLVSSALHPWHRCGVCLQKTVEAQSRPVGFLNASLSGGLVWYDPEEPHRTDDTRLEVYRIVGTSPVVMREAGFGRVVGQPVINPDEFAIRPQTADLCFDSRLLE